MKVESQKDDQVVSTDVEPRRLPVQGRSRERVNVILSSTLELIIDVGVQGLKTSEIARKAGISLPSLYRYFPNKTAIIKAIAQQHIEKLSSLMQAFLVDFDLDEGFDHLIDVYAEFYRSEPGYKEIWSGVESMPELQELDLGDLYNNADNLSVKAKSTFVGVEDERVWLICVMLPRTCGAILRLSMTMNEQQAEMLLSELKLMVKAYLRERTTSS
ncbi:TetR/AcrR family transcriptional regulator [Alkalimarinus sediminis]|uniref:TetR/AcrR family transcriptional regulator n=1 Tax=Alkalimarinus sediminis TaxID=1632866 RepID=A0A9E8HHV2_9ALTE|nr:TetR/AcrR family transcriptional regulator [Alkalimarinus sediminis]UZW74477.1 TetR/AcrR family transcriptional regulator [Alkalimarinus sediminis]